MREPIAKEMALPWKAVERIYWQFHRERTTIQKSIKRNREKPISRSTSLKELTPASELHSDRDAYAATVEGDITGIISID